MTVIDVEKLSKRYRSRVAAADVSFTVAEGEIFGILGLNGAGKTTIAECVQGLRKPDSGTIRVLGLDPHTETAELRQRIGAQLQEAALPDRVRVREAVKLFASLPATPTDWRRTLQEWGLAHRAKASFSSLSGGERQRLFVALALMGDPELVFLDELTQGLDAAARRVAWRLIREVQSRGTTVVLVTHYMDEAEELCDRLIIVDEGQVVASGSPQQLISESKQGLTVHFTTAEHDLDWLHQVENVRSVTRDGDRVAVAGSGPVLATVGAALVARGIVPDDLGVTQPSLEDVFLELTGRTAGEVA